MMMRLLFVFLLLLSINCQSQKIGQYDFGKTFNELKLDKKYQVVPYLKSVPWLFDDFNKDTKPDCAILVKQRGSQKLGILLIHGGTNEYFVLGAGKKFGNGSDDFAWADHWKLYNKKIAYETRTNNQGDLIASKKIILKYPAILIEHYESGKPISGGLIYWNGKKYIWIQQGE